MNDLPCVVYDHECSGESVGNVKDVLFSSWVEDALSVIDRLTEVVTSAGDTVIWYMTVLGPRCAGWLQSWWLAVLDSGQRNTREVTRLGWVTITAWHSFLFNVLYSFVFPGTELRVTLLPPT